MASARDIERYLTENAYRMSPGEFEDLRRELDRFRYQDRERDYSRRSERNPYMEEYPNSASMWGEPDTTNGIDKKKVFEGKPGSVLPVAIMEDLSRVTGEALKSRVAKFL